MPLDPGKFEYFRPRFPKGSRTVEQINADAERHHMGDHVHIFLAMRIAQLYDLMESGTISAQALLFPPHPDVQPTQPMQAVLPAVPPSTMGMVPVSRLPPSIPAVPSTPIGGLFDEDDDEPMQLQKPNPAAAMMNAFSLDDD